MPRPIGVIQKPGLSEDILRRLGVNRPGQPFTLDGDVVPVILIDSGVDFVASPSPAYAVTDIFTAGPQVAPPIGTILADTGQLATGSFTVTAVMSAAEANNWELQWRNAGNTANLRAIEVRVNPGQTIVFNSRFLVENVNERFRLVNLFVGGVGLTYNGTILARL